MHVTPTARPDIDAAFMAAAIRLGTRELGRTWPNPAVGALIVADRGAGPVVVGRGWTRPGGRPHAEVLALAEAGDLARGATCYVSLEPCSHHGRTPPCAEALVAAGIARVVSPLDDPDPRVAGRGHARLREAGIAVEVGPMAAEARRVHDGHIMRILRDRPRVTLKLAVSADGMIAGAGGAPVAITGAPARAVAHMLRARHDAILVGIGTVLADDPALTCRLPGMEDRSPVRVVLDGGLRLPRSAALLRRPAPAPVWVVAAADADPHRRVELESLGANVLSAPRGSDGHLDPAAVLELLAAQGITRVLVEGGATVAASLVAADLVDEAMLFHGPGVIGSHGLPAGSALAAIAGSGAYRREDRRRLGEDVLDSFARLG
ncbi:diaminohydroxyphosphoribosylaminopyrimidine deaminase/5-amino-6-(5-phosphoribosylamino)uracil reductase [Tepidamorphus gemmatus]|uniref:Riboflavin biosynthesis protein RibD n=1 Tax=Tepidamorphus gemmatus TaxID=747076 RepID=A0A4R3MEB9_9HYPH|nr:bifunctional diaminohydroxyphosphoribosylaminopyrimidine deaminase/5-amino-6-(5-phosphoribosylamino)uracil reductase RibD [Tepidamorphus gemmatus]TCT11492.1 diaminohydroxyphosphoribosylaminopyrimidine deaminase/5-amino-6-(5-phosphoribosylamino)uracil reductase [Tepidamorphus gemmatus]